MTRSKLITLLFAGTALVAAGIGVSEAGMRNLAHFVGYAGTYILLYCGVLLAGEANPNWKQVVALVVATGVVVGLLTVAARLEALNVDMAMLFGSLAVYALAIGLLIYGAKYSVGSWLRTRLPNRQLRPAQCALFLTLGVTVAMSLGWELITQPHDNVYSGEARGYSQFVQVAADLMGIAVGLGLTLGIRRRAANPRQPAIFKR